MTEPEKNKKAGSGKRNRSLPPKNDTAPIPQEQKKVGYGLPPKHAQFPKGKSGNPGGRPKGVKNLKQMIYDLVAEEIMIATQEGKKQVTIQEALARKYIEAMLQGKFDFYKLYMGFEPLLEKEIAEAVKKKMERKPIDGLHRLLESLHHPIPAPGTINIDAKLSAFSWRVINRNRSDAKDDPALIRHLYDLAKLAPKIFEEELEFWRLAEKAYTADLEDGRGKKMPKSLTETFDMLMSDLKKDPLYKEEYIKFVSGVSYEDASKQINYDAALKLLGKVRASHK